MTDYVGKKTFSGLDPTSVSPESQEKERVAQKVIGQLGTNERNVVRDILGKLRHHATQNAGTMPGTPEKVAKASDRTINALEAVRSQNPASRPDNPAHAYQDPERFLILGLHKGRIQQRTDPERLGRLRVRVIGVHGNDIHVEHLPWASPKNAAWQQGGDALVPPTAEYVWIQFERGLIEYPVWEGGWWAVGETPVGETQLRGSSKNVDLPTTLFGGDRGTGPLEMEPFQGLKPEDQPNNFVRVSPRGKHLEMDDREKIEKLKLADQMENGMTVDSMEAVAGIEVAQPCGQTPAKPRKRFGTVWSYLKSVIQSYTNAGWLVTTDDINKVWDVASPLGYRVRIDETSGVIQLITKDGHQVVLDDTNKKLIARTLGGRTLTLDDNAQITTLTTPKAQLRFDDDLQKYVMSVDGDLKLQATGKMELKCDTFVLDAFTRADLDGVPVDADVRLEVTGYDTPAKPEKVDTGIGSAVKTAAKFPFKKKKTDGGKAY